jgi:DNA-binding NtrC family response regulator
MPPSEKTTLLFVDDDPEFIKVVRQLLANEVGLELLWKDNGSSAIAAMGENPGLADFVFVDFKLPDIEGITLARQLREKKIGIPIILLTSQRDVRLAINAIRSEIDDYVVKDDIIDSSLARSLMNVIERIRLRNKIAAQQRADLIARRKTEAIKELVVTVCHEFNNPLAAMKISANILSRQELSPDEKVLIAELETQIQSIEEEITKLRELNIDKFDLSKL